MELVYRNRQSRLKIGIGTDTTVLRASKKLNYRISKTTRIGKEKGKTTRKITQTSPASRW